MPIAPLPYPVKIFFNIVKSVRYFHRRSQGLVTPEEKEDFELMWYNPTTIVPTIDGPGITYKPLVEQRRKLERERKEKAEAMRKEMEKNKLEL